MVNYKVTGINSIRSKILSGKNSQLEKPIYSNIADEMVLEAKKRIQKIQKDIDLIVGEKESVSVHIKVSLQKTIEGYNFQMKIVDIEANEKIKQQILDLTN